MEKNFLDELQVTLVELDKAVKHLNGIVHTAHELGLLQSLLGSSNSSRGSGFHSIINLVKQIDWKEIMALAQSPMIQNMLTDPELFELFAPDSELQNKDKS